MFNLATAALATAIVSTGVLASDVYVYTNMFVNSTYMLSDKFPDNTIYARNTILDWAEQSTQGGPWSVMNKSVTPSTGTKHTYLSWAPYWWPDCSKVGNKTVMPPEEVWVKCTYYQRDGVFNPDYHLVNDTVTVNKMCEAVLYNSMAWALEKTDKYAQRAAHYIDTWFINPETYMYPNLDYGQMHRGPDGQNGTKTGVLDLHCMAKVATGVLILRNGESAAWTPKLDNAMQKWSSDYLKWLQTAKIALQEKAATNNHGTFYYNQVAALKLILNDQKGAGDLLHEYFNGIYQGQIDSNGEQPLEASRTRPYHYRIYNLGSLFTNARLAEYVGYNAWNLKTKSGGTIKKALDFTMSVDPGDEGSETGLKELVAAGGSVFGDKGGKYAAFLKKAEKAYPTEPYFLWDQPFSDSGYSS